MKITKVLKQGLLLITMGSICSTTWAAPDNALVPTVQEIRLEACQQHLTDAHHGNKQTLRDEVNRYQLLAEQALTYREESIRIAGRLKQRMDSDLPLSGKDLDNLNAGTIAHLELREKLLALAESHECWLNLSNAEMKASGLSKADVMQGVMVSLSSALLLYDNYLLAISLFEEDAKLRRFLNDRDSGYQKGRLELAKVTLSYNAIENRSRVKTAIRFYEKNIPDYKAALAQDASLAYLDALIQQSPSYNMTKEFSPLLVLGRKLGFMESISRDALLAVGNEGMNIFSALFGNIVGLVEFRKGKLYQRPDVLDTVSGQLEAGDILLEKTPFRLTDKFIPGHWGHAAVWVGTEQELKALGIWQHEIVKPHHEAISGNHLIVEALRSGVEMSSLDKFSNVDDAVILRERVTNDQERIAIILQALRQVGKSYDFNFDVETTDRIVCSELVYITHTEIEWPTDNTLGRETISPDNIAKKALDGGPLKVVLLYHDGQLVAAEGAVQKMGELMSL